MTVDRFALETLADQLGGSLQWPDNADTDARVQSPRHRFEKTARRE